jgi:hypothetical protein
MTTCRFRFALVALAAMTIPSGIANDLENAWSIIRSVIHSDDQQKAEAMRSAPLILLAKIEDVELYREPRQVENPESVGGPMVPVIPLHLAKISAKPLLFLRGSESDHITFYSWIWASGKHGGPRLFHATPESFHVLFLKRDYSYLHTVGDYPSYDIEVRSDRAQNFTSGWEAEPLRGEDLLERIAAVLLKADLESLDEADAARYWLNTYELVELTSRKFVASQLSNLCSSLPNPGGRVKACSEYRQWR